MSAVRKIHRKKHNAGIKNGRKEAKRIYRDEVVSDWIVNNNREKIATMAIMMNSVLMIYALKNHFRFSNPMIHKMNAALADIGSKMKNASDNCTYMSDLIYGIHTSKHYLFIRRRPPEIKDYQDKIDAFIEAGGSVVDAIAWFKAKVAGLRDVENHEIMMLKALAENFGFGKVRLERFANIMRGYDGMSFDEYQEKLEWVRQHSDQRFDEIEKALQRNIFGDVDGSEEEKKKLTFEGCKTA